MASASRESPNLTKILFCSSGSCERYMSQNKGLVSIPYENERGRMILVRDSKIKLMIVSCEYSPKTRRKESWSKRRAEPWTIFGQYLLHIEYNVLVSVRSVHTSLLAFLERTVSLGSPVCQWVAYICVPSQMLWDEPERRNDSNETQWAGNYEANLLENNEFGKTSCFITIM